MFIIMFIVTMALSWFMIVGFSVAGLGYPIVVFWDAVSLSVLIILTLPMMVASGLLKDFIHACSIILHSRVEYTLNELEKARLAINLLIKLVIVTTILAVSMCLIMIIRQSFITEDTFLPNIAVNTISVVYAMIFEMCLIPMEARLKKMILERKEKE